MAGHSHAVKPEHTNQRPDFLCFFRFFPCQLSHPVFFLEKAELIGLKFRVLCGDGLSALLRVRHVLLPSIFTTAPIRVGGAAVRGKNGQAIPAVQPGWMEKPSDQT